MAANELSVLSLRSAIRLNSLSLAKKFSIRCRHAYLMFVIGSLVCAVGFWRYDALDLGLLKQSENPFPGIIGFISQNRLNMVENTGQQCIRAVKIMGLSRPQVNAGRVA